MVIFQRHVLFALTTAVSVDEGVFLSDEVCVPRSVAQTIAVCSKYS